MKTLWTSLILVLPLVFAQVWQRFILFIATIDVVNVVRICTVKFT